MNDNIGNNSAGSDNTKTPGNIDMVLKDAEAPLKPKDLFEKTAEVEAELDTFIYSSKAESSTSQQNTTQVAQKPTRSAAQKAKTRKMFMFAGCGLLAAGMIAGTTVGIVYGAKSCHAEKVDINIRQIMTTLINAVLQKDTTHNSITLIAELSGDVHDDAVVTWFGFETIKDKNITVDSSVSNQITITYDQAFVDSATEIDIGAKVTSIGGKEFTSKNFYEIALVPDLPAVHGPMIFVVSSTDPVIMYELGQVITLRVAIIDQDDNIIDPKSGTVNWQLDPNILPFVNLLDPLDSSALRIQYKDFVSISATYQIDVNFTNDVPGVGPQTISSADDNNGIIVELTPGLNAHGVYVASLGPTTLTMDSNASGHGSYTESVRLIAYYVNEMGVVDMGESINWIGVELMNPYCTTVANGNTLDIFYDKNWVGDNTQPALEFNIGARHGTLFSNEVVKIVLLPQANPPSLLITSDYSTTLSTTGQSITFRGSIISDTGLGTIIWDTSLIDSYCSVDRSIDGQITITYDNYVLADDTFNINASVDLPSYGTITSNASLTLMQFVPDLRGSIDGTTWDGYNSGIFAPKDYTIDYVDRTVTYHSNTLYTAGHLDSNNTFEGLVVPAYVTSGSQTYKVIIGTGMLKDADLNGELIISEGIDSIGVRAFMNCDQLETLTLPDSLTQISETAFSGCDGLSGNLVLPDAGNLKTIGISAFNGCRGFVGDLIIPDSVTTIGDLAFKGCLGFDQLCLPDNSNFNTMGIGAFSGCSGLTGTFDSSGNVYPNTLYLPDTLTKISEANFAYCTGFEILRLPENPNFTEIGTSAFSGCTGFTGTLDFSWLDTNAPGFWLINSGAFQYCSGFTGALIIPDSVYDLGWSGSTFAGCSGFSSLHLPTNSRFTRINSNVFNGCINLGTQADPISGEIDLIIPDSVTYIGNWAFCECIGYTGPLVLSDNIESLGAGTFRSCNFTGELVIPATLIWGCGEYAFMNCKRLTSVVIHSTDDPTLNWIQRAKGVFYGCSGLTSITFVGFEYFLPMESVGFICFSFCWGPGVVNIADCGFGITSTDALQYAYTLGLPTSGDWTAG